VEPIFVLANAKEGLDFARSLHWEYEKLQSVLRYWWVWPLAFLLLIVLQLSDMLKGHYPTGMSICAVLR